MAYDNTTNLIVNYLPQTLTDAEFRSMFLSIGALKASKIVRDRATGYSYGFGFVDYARDEDAIRAIQTLNGLQLQNKRIKVAYSRSGESIKGANLYVSNLPKDMTQAKLEEIFAEYGSIIQCRILTDNATGRSKGVGFVLYNNRAEAENAMKNCDGYIPEGGTGEISVKFADDNKGKARAPPMLQGGLPMGRGRGRGGAGAGANFNSHYNGGGNNYGGGYGGSAYGGGGYGEGDGYGYEEEEVEEVDMGFGQGYGGPAGYGAAMPRGGGRGFGAGPMRSQNRFNRFNPMAGGQGVGRGVAPGVGGGRGGIGARGGARGGGNFGNGAVGGAGGGGSLEGGFTLFVYNIGPKADERELWQLFSPYGTIQKVNVIRDHQKDAGKGYGFVTMTTYHEAMGAIQALNGYRYVGKPLQVSFKSNKD